MTVVALNQLLYADTDRKGAIKEAAQFRNKLIYSVENEISLYKSKDALSKFRFDKVTQISVDQIRKDFGNSTLPLTQDVKLTVAPISYGSKVFDKENGAQFTRGTHEYLDYRIQAAIFEAIKQKSNILVFPELCLPRKYLYKYLKSCAHNNIILIGGLEYVSSGSKYAVNSTIISFPVNRFKNPYSRDYLAFEQVKHFPAAEEWHFLKNSCNVDYLYGQNLFLFLSDIISNFSILTCSDFLSMRLRLKLQEKVQMLFVPAQNIDNTTYDHIAESSIRDLHCFSVICNNQKKGSSFIYGPLYNKRERTILKVEGSIVPEFSTVTFKPSVLLQSHKAPSHVPFRGEREEEIEREIKLKDLKQIPPDWGRA